MNKIPFKAYFRVVPERGSGKRFEIHRSRERMAHLVWYDLNENLENAMEVGGSSSGGINFAVPGGSIEWQLSIGELSQLMKAVAFKPQFGEAPETLTIVGFYDSDSKVPYNEKMLISGNEVWNGPATGTPAWDASTSPNSDNRTQATALKIALENAITSVPVEMIKLEVNGVVYGRGGLHFPLSS